jgi:hypothetical protein
MAIHEVSFITTVTTATANTPIGSLRSDTTDRCRVIAVELFQITAGTSPNGVGLARATNTPAGGTTAAAERISAPTGTTSNAVGVISGWSTAPTITTIFKRWIGGTAVGNAYPFTWSPIQPLLLPLGGTTGGELVIVNLFATVAPTFAVNITFETE